MESKPFSCPPPYSAPGSRSCSIGTMPRACQQGPGGQYFPTLGQPVPNNAYTTARRKAREDDSISCDTGSGRVAEPGGV
ncbi:hypothetical protein GCM10020218_072110 [Dactylosporangium vinaceum]